jgi:DNA modification methylase
MEITESQTIETLNTGLKDKFANITIEDSNLSRQVVSFQANKQLPIYRWYKYKEGFSAELIRYLFDKYLFKKGKILDPFAGTGTALFAASEEGYDADGIELLPIGQTIIKTRSLIESSLGQIELSRLDEWCNKKLWNKTTKEAEFTELRITFGAYPKETENKIRRYLTAISEEHSPIKEVLFLALLCILESVSYTRKDGQYLRWDYRSGRTNGKKPFDKGIIQNFDSAISLKLKEILQDLRGEQKQTELFKSPRRPQGRICLYESSCLEQLPLLQNNDFAAIITSPPYCNRYDYTRTYALELAMLGVNEERLRTLRQNMLSCTVENKEKDLLKINPGWGKIFSVVKDQQLLQEIINYLQYLKDEGQLNNDGIVRMVKGYFYEMSCVIYECHRVLKKGGYFFMINDNVKYAGIGVPVDLILSNIAALLGFEVKNILVLPQDKGNSSQQMGRHGREALRKCVYVWQKE